MEATVFAKAWGEHQLGAFMKGQRAKGRRPTSELSEPDTDSVN